MLKDDRFEACENEIIKLRDQAFSRFYEIKSLSLSRQALIEGKYSLSFAWYIYKMIIVVDVSTANLYKNPKYSHKSVYRKLYQREWDKIFEICIKANKLGLNVFPKINPNNDLSYLNPEEQLKLLEVFEEALNRYFDILVRINKDYLDEENQFISRMLKFGDNHGMNENDLVAFANKAFKIGINVANIDSQEELDEVYKKVFPEA